MCATDACKSHCASGIFAAERIRLRYKSLRIRNFKGIKDTTVELESVAGANVFAFVGLNESGKTTLLEAIHSFSPDKATNELLGGETGVPFKDRVPRHLISEFTGDVSVTATLSVTPDDKKAISKRLLEDHKLILDVESFPDNVVLERLQRFENGDFKKGYLSYGGKLQVRGEKERKWRNMSGTEEMTNIINTIFRQIPDIAYFPTFVFDFPASIYLTDRGGTVDQFYRRVFQDILDYDNRGHTIEKDIVGRVRVEKLTVPWLLFLTSWREHDDREKIQHVMDRAGAAVTRLVFGRWNKIFKEDVKGKEIVISYDIVEGETKDSQGNLTKRNLTIF
jgi:hypothetical protein